MLIIHSTQITDLARQSYEHQLAEHLRRFSPPLVNALGDDQMRVVIRYGRERAEANGFTLRGPTRTYVEFMLLFGSSFDTDLQYPWAARILAQSDLSEMERAQALYDEAVLYQQQVAGDNDGYALQALRNLRSLADNPLPSVRENYVRDIHWLIAQAYPQKAAYIGSSGIDGLIREAAGVVRAHDLTTLDALTLLVVLMLAFGHGCCNDPLYPWIAATMRDPLIKDSEARTERLKRKALTWLDHVLAHLDAPGA